MRSALPSRISRARQAWHPPSLVTGSCGDGDDRRALAAALAEVGRDVRAALARPAAAAADRAVVRAAGGDDIFGLDTRAEAAVLAGFEHRIAERWPGTLVMEGFDEPVVVGARGGHWRHLVDPVDGTRPYLAAKRSAWVLLGAGPHAATLDELEVGAAVELASPRAAVALTAWAVADGSPPVAVDDDVTDAGRPPRTVALRPRGGDLAHRYVTVARCVPGAKGAIDAWEDEVLAGLTVYEDSYLASGGQLMEVARGAEAAVLDPRPLLAPGTPAAHPYDLAAVVVARAAGVSWRHCRPVPSTTPSTPPPPSPSPPTRMKPWQSSSAGSVGGEARADLGRGRPIPRRPHLRPARPARADRGAPDHP